MSELTLLTSSSLLPSTPNRQKTHRNPNPRNPNPKPLLSDVRLNLSTQTAATAGTTTTRRLLKYYARLASNLAKSGKLFDFLMVAETVLTSESIAGEAPQFVARVNTRAVAAGVSEAARAGRFAEVLDFLAAAARLGFVPASLVDGDAVAAECRRLVEERRLDELVGLMETLAGYGFSIKDILAPVDVLKLFVEKRDPDMAVRYANIFPHSQLLLCSIIQEFGKKQDLTSALRAFEELKNKSGGINMFAWRCIIDVCGLCSNFLKSRSIFEDLLAQRITPNIYVVNSLMNVNSHDLSYTLHVYKHMQNLGITMDMTSYNILLKACCNAKRVDLAQDMYMEIKHLALKGALKLDVITYTTMIKVFAEAKMWQMAFSVKEDMLLTAVSPNMVTWSSLIGACANAGLLDRAIQTFEEMLMAGCEPNAQCCNNLLYACLKSCQYDRAFRLYYAWKETGFKILRFTKGKGYGSVDINLTENDSGQSITTIYDLESSKAVKVVPFKPTVATFNILMKACGTDYYRAKALMDEMKAMGLSADHISWSVLIDIYGTSQNMKGAIEAFRAMRDVGLKLDVVAYTTAIKACVENKNLKMAFRLFQEMKRDRLQPNWVTYNTLLRARRRYGSLLEVQQCLAIYQDMRRAGYRSNDYYLKELLEEWCEEVICSNSRDRALTSTNKTNKIIYSKKPHSLLLEKVARHLQKDVGDNQAIDIRGLTKVEARIVVLSVLWRIRDSYRSGKMVQEDMIIVSGVGKEVEGKSSHELEVQLAIVKVLQDELGLDVVTGYGTVPSPLDDASDTAAFQKIESPKDYKHMARRPEDLGVLKVPKESLCHWLQRREST